MYILLLWLLFSLRPPPVVAGEASDKDGHGLIRTSRLHRVVVRLRALAPLARELASRGGVQSVGEEHGVAVLLHPVQVPAHHVRGQGALPLLQLLARRQLIFRHQHHAFGTRLAQQKTYP